jgi:hypothetical protein
LFDIQVVPELVVNQIRFSSVATSVIPSADDATEINRRTGALFVTQEAPEFVEVKIQCLPETITAATNLVPSAEDATAFQLAESTLFEAQFIPELLDVW